MISPPSSGIYQAQWRMCTPMGQYFGGTVKSFIDPECGGFGKILPAGRSEANIMQYGNILPNPAGRGSINDMLHRKNNSQEK